MANGFDKIMKMQFYQNKASWKLSSDRKHAEPELEDEDEAHDEGNEAMNFTCRNGESECTRIQHNEAFFKSALHHDTLSYSSDASEETANYAASSSGSELPEDIVIFCQAEEALNSSTAFLKNEEHRALTESDDNVSFMLEAAEKAHSSPIPDDTEGHALIRNIYRKTKELKHLLDLALEEELRKKLSFAPAPETQLACCPHPPLGFQPLCRPGNLWDSPGWCTLVKIPPYTGGTSIGRGRGRILN